MKCQISVSAPNRKHPEPVVRGVEAVEKTLFFEQPPRLTTLQSNLDEKPRPYGPIFFCIQGQRPGIMNLRCKFDFMRAAAQSTELKCCFSTD